MHPKTVKITLEIQTNVLFTNFDSTTGNAPFGSTPNWISFVKLSDDNKGKSPNSAGNFESFLNPGSKVIWKATIAKAKAIDNSKYKVSIIEIYNSPQGNSPIFSKTTIKAEKNGKVTATVLPTASTSEPGPNEIYSISFSVTLKSNNVKKHYGFDPKLKINPTP